MIVDALQFLLLVPLPQHSYVTTIGLHCIECIVLRNTQTIMFNKIVSQRLVLLLSFLFHFLLPAAILSQIWRSSLGSKLGYLNKSTKSLSTGIEQPQASRPQFASICRQIIGKDRYHLSYTVTTNIEMTHSSNVMIHGGTFISAQGDLHIHNGNLESGMHTFTFIQKSILIDDVKDFISFDKEFLLEQFMTRPNATHRQIVTLIPARPFERSFQTGFRARVLQLYFSGFTDLLVPVRQPFFRQLQSFCALHPNPVRISEPAFSFRKKRKGATTAIFYFRQSHTNSL